MRLNLLSAYYYFLRYKERGYVLIIIFLLSVVSFKLLNIYLIKDFNLIQGLLFAPLILYIPDKKRKSNRFACIALSMLFIYLFVPVLTIFFFAFASGILYFIESKFGKLNNSVFIHVLLISSISRYFVNIFSFPMRIKLTTIAGNLLNIIGFSNSTQGNVLIHNGNSFSVDPDCMGLKMVITAFIVMLLFITFLEKRNRSTVRLSGLVVLSIINIILLLVNNLLRIVALVLFHSPEGSFSHEFIGIIGFLIYNLIPLYLITPFIVSFFGKKIIPNHVKKEHKHFGQYFFLIFFASFLAINIQYQPLNSLTAKNIYLPHLNGYHQELTQNNILKLYSNKALLYVKPPVKFYGSDHNPYICWQGSGYNFKNIKVYQINHYKIYMAELVSDHDKLYTSWWYGNDKEITIDQLDWRWKTIKGNKTFCLYNMTSYDKHVLIAELKKLIP